jgi:hypothetical protein
MSASNHAWRALSCNVTALVLTLLVLIPIASALADDIDVRTANIGLADGYWRLNARIDYRLTEEIEEALKSGVSLTFRVELVVDRVRNWLPNQEVLELTRDWQLSYEPLSERYLVAYPDGREPTSHVSVFGALNAAGRLQGIPVMEEPRLDPRESYTAALRAALNQKTLPAPLQMLAFWDDGFSLESDWYEWTLAP